jgi:hypothetical protein
MKRPNQAHSVVDAPIAFLFHIVHHLRAALMRSVMPASFLAELLEPVFQAVFEVACYYAGRVVVPVISVGRWKCDALLRDVPKKKLRLAGLYHLRGDQVYLTAETTALVGLLFAVLVIAAGVLWWLYGR